MIGFLLGVAAGVAGYWAYQRYIVGSDDDAFADFETSSLDRPSTTEIGEKQSESTSSTSTSSTGTASTTST